VKLRRLVLLLTLVTVVPLGAGSAAPSLVNELGKLREQWAADLHAKRLGSILSLYTPDAVFLSSGHSRVTGSAALGELMKNIMGRVTSDLHFRSLNMESSGALAYDSGEYDETLTPTSGGPDKKLQGSYVIIWKHQANGQWKIVQQVWTLEGNDPVAGK
jgi:ketosteroid isomerase-like protein